MSQISLSIGERREVEILRILNHEHRSKSFILKTF